MNHPSAATRQVFDLDLDACLTLTADSRPWLRRTAWHDRAACHGCHPDTYVGELPPSRSDLERCVGCPVRTECAVDGLRQNLDGVLAKSPEELWGYFGGLGPDERWHLAGALQRLAAERGIALSDAQGCGEVIEQHHAAGWLTTQIADELNLPHEHIIDHLALSLADRGWSNRRIAAALPGHSYKWFERRIRRLRATAQNICEAA